MVVLRGGGRFLMREARLYPGSVSVLQTKHEVVGEWSKSVNFGVRNCPVSPKWGLCRWAHLGGIGHVAHTPGMLATRMPGERHLHHFTSCIERVWERERESVCVCFVCVCVCKRERERARARERDRESRKILSLLPTPRKLHHGPHTVSYKLGWCHQWLYYQLYQLGPDNSWCQTFHPFGWQHVSQGSGLE